MSATESALWDALSERLPGLRRPAVTRGLSRDDVAAVLGQIEAAVARDVARAFVWGDDGSARLTVAGRTHRAGRFAIPTIGELEGRVRHRAKNGRVTLSVVLGAHPLTDVGALQAMAGPGTLFQVASQFNCLEAPGPYLVPIADYVDDNTQGPRAAVSAYPGTFLRHYAAPAHEGTRFTQTSTRQINLLADALPPDVAVVDGGYLRAGSTADPQALQHTLEAGFDRIRVGVHDEVDVVFGGNWGGPVATDAPTIAQVCTSTMALGMYSRAAGDAFDGACSVLLRAAYLGTLLAALDLGKQAVVLTLIGGGAFGNSLRSIWDALQWAVDQAADLAPSDLAVVLNARVMGSEVPRVEVAGAVGARNGAIVDARSDDRF
jgi:hypothetical protein